MIIGENQNPLLRGRPPKKHVSAFFSEMQDPFGGITGAERAAVFADLGRHHTESFTRSIARLQEVCRSCNIFQLLAHFAYYDQIVLDSGAKSSAYQPIGQHGAELLQAMLLQIPEEALSDVLEATPPPELLLESNALLSSIPKSFALKRLGTPDAGDKNSRLLAEMVRAHTTAVRNEGFPSQVRRLMAELFMPLDEGYERKTGLKLTGPGIMLWNVCALIEKRINDDFQQRKVILGKPKADAIVDGFLRLHCPDAQRAEQFRTDIAKAQLSLRDLRGYLHNLWDNGNFKFFYLSLEDWATAYPGGADSAKVSQVLACWSLAFGDLAAQQPEHFFLNNPVWAKPIIHVGPERYMLPFPALVQSFGRQLLETLVEAEPALWEKYLQDVRPAYLEDTVATWFASALPSARVLRGVEWDDPTSGRRYENDLLVLCDTHALVVECKAGRISSRARRGDVTRLEREIGKLVADPTVQGQRLAEFLTQAGGEIEVQDANRQKHRIDTNQLLRITRINVTLDYLGPVGIQARLLRETGMIAKELEPAATFSLHELGDVMEVLDRPAPLFHYLRRRAEIESANDLMASEHSLLALYLATGFDIGELEGGETRTLALPDMEGELEPYFMGKEIQRPVPKPKLRLTSWWNDMLQTLQQRSTWGWMESSYALLCVGHSRQKQFERGMKKMLKEVRSNWHRPDHRNVCFLVAGPPHRRVKVACVGVKNVTLEEQRDTVRRAIDAANETEPTPATLAIVKSVNTGTYPYSAAYFSGPRLNGTAENSQPTG